MKRIVCILLSAAVFLAFASCSKDGSPEDETTETVSITESESAADVDLTTLSTTMAYSQLYNMTIHPENFIGKTVKLRGKYGVYDGEGRKYYVCEVMDETACCSQGLEFILSDGEEYPEYDPEAPVTIEVIGTFNTYTEDNQPYVQLEDAVIT